MSRTRSKVLGCMLCVAVLGGACSDDGGSGSTTATTVVYDVDAGVGSPAADLRAELTTLLQEHVLLVGITTDARLAGADTAPAAAVLDENAVALGAVVIRQYGPETGLQFLDTWRRHTAGLVDFTSVAASTDRPTVASAKADLTAIAGEITTVLNTANYQLTPEALTKSLGAYAAAVQAAITAQAKKDVTAPTKLREATGTMSDLAIVLAAGIVKDKGEAIAGKLDAISAVVRTSLATKLQEHAYLAGITSGAMLGGGDAEPVTAALDVNSVELSRAVGAVYGDEAGTQFLTLWRQRTGLLVDFTEAAAGEDSTGAEEVRDALVRNAGGLAALLAGANPKLEESDVAEELGKDADHQLAAIEAQAAGDPAQFDTLRHSATRMSRTALLLATGIARQFPTKFG